MAVPALDSSPESSWPMGVDRSGNKHDLNQGTHGFNKNKNKNKTSMRKSRKQGEEGRDKKEAGNLYSLRDQVLH